MSDQPIDPTLDDIMAQCIEIELERRKMALLCLKTLEANTLSDDLCPRVKFAINQAIITAAERLGRIFRSDLLGGE